MPVRNRYKVFIIDEVHQLSHALVQRAAEIDRGAAAARRVHDGDDRALEDSRDRAVALAGVRVQDDLEQADRRSASQDRRTPRRSRSTIRRCCWWRRAAEGSMRDAQSAFDQVIAFAGQKVSADDVATVLGLVGRDLVLDIVTAVADETPAAAFELTGRAVELGYDLRLGRSRAVARRARSAGAFGRSVAHRRSRDCVGERARSAEGARRRASRARICCARSTCCRKPSPRSAAPRSPGITSRWRCCAGFTCASSCR